MQISIEKEKIHNILNEEMQRRKINEDRVIEYERETSKIIEKLKR